MRVRRMMKMNKMLLMSCTDPTQVLHRSYSGPTQVLYRSYTSRT